MKTKAILLKNICNKMRSFWLAGLLYGIIFGILAIIRVWVGGVGVSDLAIFHTALLGTTHGNFYFTYLAPEGCFFYQRFDPVVLLYLPFYYFMGNKAWMILVVSQAMMVGLGLPALAAIGKQDGLNFRAIFFLSVMFFLNPVLHNVIMYDFHPVTLAFPLILWGWYFNKKKEDFYRIDFLDIGHISQHRRGQYLFNKVFVAWRYAVQYRKNVIYTTSCRYYDGFERR
jgi:uncharacterized membrane protein